MKKNKLYPFFVLSNLMIFLLFWLAVTTKSSAEIEIDLDEVSKPASKATPTPIPSHREPTFTPTTVPVKQPAAVVRPEVQAAVEEKEEMPEATPTPLVVHGSLKMKNIYEAGINAYKEKDYDQAIRYLMEAVKKNDAYTPKYYYAEAYATLGIIYQFHLINYTKAYGYYKAALKYEKNNPTAKKHLREVSKKNKRKL